MSEQSAPAVSEPPGWSVSAPVRHDGINVWWASRGRLLTESEVGDGVRHNVCALSEHDLGDLLNEQTPHSPILPRHTNASAVRRRGGSS